MGGSVLTLYQRDQAMCRREAHRFRTLTERLIGTELDFFPTLHLLAALEVEYQYYLKGHHVTRDSLMRHLNPGTDASREVLARLAQARESCPPRRSSEY